MLENVAIVSGTGLLLSSGFNRQMSRSEAVRVMLPQVAQLSSTTNLELCVSMSRVCYQTLLPRVV